MCSVLTKDFPAIIPDNDNAYLQFLLGIVDSIDELASLEVRKAPTHLNFRIAPSMPIYSESLLQEILKMHNMFGFKLELGKSIKASGSITFNLNFQ